MKITHTEIIPVAVPTRPDAVNSPDWGDDGWGPMEHCVLKVHTDEGLVGLGETQRGVSRGAARAAAKALEGVDPMAVCLQDIPLGGDVSQALVGAGSTTYPARRHELNMAGSPAYDAFEMALFDLVGKALRVPVHKLLGGAYRDRVPVDFWFGRRSPADAERLARRAREMGYFGLKMKNALEDPTVAQVEAITRGGGDDFLITIDPNERFYRPAEAIRLAQELERFKNVAMFEDPMPKWNLDWYRLFRQKTSVPVTLHLGSPQDVINAIKAEACDYMNLGGSMVNFVKCATIADAAGIPVWHGAGVDLGLLEASYVHASAVCRNCVQRGDVFGRLIREHDLLATPLQIKDGYATVPTGPGLGVELDDDAVERYRVRD
jgi:muconate cycloisomerase